MNRRTPRSSALRPGFAVLVALMLLAAACGKKVAWVRCADGVPCDDYAKQILAKYGFLPLA
jgi:hypothetical protein